MCEEPEQKDKYRDTDATTATTAKAYKEPTHEERLTESLLSCVRESNSFERQIRYLHNHPQFAKQLIEFENLRRYDA